MLDLDTTKVRDDGLEELQERSPAVHDDGVFPDEGDLHGGAVQVAVLQLPRYLVEETGRGALPVQNDRLQAQWKRDQGLVGAAVLVLGVVETHLRADEARLPQHRPVQCHCVPEGFDLVEKWREE